MDKRSLWQRKALKGSRLRLLIWGVLAAFLVVVRQRGSAPMANAPRVFLSYSHDSDEHAARVLALADSLCDGGIDVILDRYVHPAHGGGLAPLDRPEPRRGQVRPDSLHRDLPPTRHGPRGAW